jgi:DNA-binding IclR family transcriptional regulator
MLPAHCTAVGKAQLAFLPAAELERLYPEQNLPACTEKSIKSRDSLGADLRFVTERGYAVENEECDLDVRSIAVPIRDFSKNIVAALGIVGPFGRLSDERLEKAGVIKLLLESGKALSSKMGFIDQTARKER